MCVMAVLAKLDSKGRQDAEAVIKALTQRFDVEIVFKLSLAGRQLQAIQGLGNAINLTDLDVSCNNLTRSMRMAWQRAMHAIHRHVHAPQHSASLVSLHLGMLCNVKCACRAPASIFTMLLEQHALVAGLMD